MAAFDYIAIDEKGKQSRGILQADSARQIRQQLRQRGLTPVAVNPVTDEPQSAVGSIHLTRGFSNAEQALLLRQLATLLRSGEPLSDALQALIQGEQPARIRKVLAAVRAQVLEGQSLASAMSAYPRHFPELMVASVGAGERAGKLVEVMQRLALFAQQREQLGRSTLLALLYPLLLAVMSILVVAGLVTYVVPRVVVVFSAYQQSLPWPTQLLIGVSDFLRGNAAVLVLAMAAMVVAGVLLWRAPKQKAKLQTLALGLPVIGRLLRASEAARFTRTLAILLGSAVPMVDALRVSARVASTEPVQAHIRQAAASVREGAGLAVALRQGKWLPPVVLQLIASGEQSGDLPFLLDQAADIQEQDLDAAIGVVTGLAQPLLILIVGVVVLFIVLAIMLPILDLNTFVGN